MSKTFITAMLLLAGSCIYAQDFVYTPKNPAFGGSPYNYSWMLSSAESQNTIEAPEDDSYDPYSSQSSSSVDDFAESLNRQILSRLSRELVTRQFGEDALEEGSYVLGDYQIDIGDSDSGINITIVDNVTGSTTTVEVPYF
ncbi:curli production assembly/transport component CsgF [Draconibacterium orientale]|uniref:Curli production assembly/transport component CsgF n=1 Tax=Draconibacterium orientale TaxID=1168034 RepID=X5E2V9_9BACT|nr:curli production assembly/transport component CsgF [Draconibacterium orientale]AHW60951.1 Curli production assembly/transport component CsgF [Draconibacterium orientale]SEU17000.1 curli production assembly/transport component CsgF [Draconibacterium orientale]